LINNLFSEKSLKIAKEFLEWSLRHITECGDTDIFPFPFELEFLREKANEIADELSQLDATQYHPMSLIEALIPKSKFGFRIAHQIYPADLVYFTGLVLSISETIESGRDPKGDGRAFSYRVMPKRTDEIFDPNHKFRNWTEYLFGTQVFSDNYSSVIFTDISDFYSRIYRHRLENIIESLTGSKKIAKTIESFLKDWRSRQSFGIPVGNTATRILAEVALNDMDLALKSEGLDASRYVDDIVIFVQNEQDPYAALGFLANHLAIGEGLSLNNQKTKIIPWDDFVGMGESETGEDDEDADTSAVERLFWAAYGNEEMDEEALNKLLVLDLQKELEEHIEAPLWDMGKIRVILKAMRLTKNVEAAKYVRENLPTLVPFAKDVVLLIEDFVKSGDKTFDGMENDLVDLILSKKLLPLDSSRAWLLELSVRGHVKFSAAHIKRLEQLTGTLDVRQQHLIRYSASDLNFFRMRKTKVDEMPQWVQPSFIFSARCLPRDEYEAWIASIRSRVSFPLAKLFLKWCLERKALQA
jgi:hypothetical protein